MNQMPTTIAQIFSLNRNIKPEALKRREPVVTSLCTPLPRTANAKSAHQFESEVFKFLFENRRSLDIETVFTFKNYFMDGAIQLIDGRRFAVEAKLRMNWTKALQAQWEFKRFLQCGEPFPPVDGAIVVFEEFQGARWQRKSEKRRLQDGWNRWYELYSSVEGLPFDLLRFRQGTLEYYELAQENSRTGH
jgi:hypothetical protein